MKRVGTLQVLAKRQISLAVSGAHTAESSVIASPANMAEETPKVQQQTHIPPKQSISVAKFMDLAYQPYQLSQRRISDSPGLVVTLTEAQMEMGDEIRVAMKDRDVKRLSEIIFNLRKLSNWSAITEGLTRPEISLLLKTLIEGQYSEARTMKQFNNIVERDVMKSTKRSVDRLSNNILILFWKLKRTEGFNFTSSDLEHMLEFETVNYNYGAAAKLITYIESIKACHHSVLYYNLKFRVLGNTDPVNWKTGHNKTLTASAFKGTVKNAVPFSSLLLDFSKVSKTVSPDLSSHREIISGFGKSGDLEQVRTHIEQIWSITTTGPEPLHILPMTSALYPDSKLLESIISVFGYNKKTLEALQYVEQFCEHYNMNTHDNTHIWRVLTTVMEVEHEGGDNVQAFADKFEMMWAVMKKLKAKFTPALYFKRLQILSAAQRHDTLSKDLPLLWEKCYKADSYVQRLRIQKLLTLYLKTISLSIYSSLPKEQSRRIVKNYMKNYSVDQSHYQELLALREELVSKVQKNIDSFETLQRQFDEEDEEDALW